MCKFVSRPLLLLLAATLSLVLSGCNATFKPIAPAEPGSERSTPVITWAQPAPITYPTPLGAAQLDATANVAGTSQTGEVDEDVLLSTCCSTPMY